MSEQLSILVVEDDHELRELLVEVLEEQDYFVQGAGSGPEAVEKARDVVFDLVITDIRMGEMNGLETLKEVREESPDFESMVITGYADEDIPARALRMGVGEYLKKPFELDDFVKAVERLLSDYRRKREERNDLQDTRRVAIWGAEGRASDRNDSAAVAAGRLSWGLAGELGLSYEEAEQLQLSTLVSLMDGTDDPPPSAQTARVLLRDSARAREIWQACRELYNQKTLVDEAPYISSLPDALPYTEELTKALQQLANFGAYGLGRDPVNRRKWQSLLSLAEALIKRGDHRGAAQAYASVAKDGGSRESLEALLGLSRAHIVAEKQDAAVKWALEAVKKAQSVGPLKRSQVTLEAGSILAQLGHEKAKPCLEAALKTIREFHLAELLPTAEISYAVVIEQKVKEALEKHTAAILDYSQLPQLKSSLRWFLPLLLSKSQASTESLLRRLCQQFSEQLQQLLGSGELSPQATEAARRLLKPAESVPQKAEPKQDHTLRCYSLGAFEVYLGEKLIDPRGWKSQKTRYLLAYLAAHRGRPVAEERILEDFWEGKSKSNLYAACSHLRKQLRPPNSQANFIIRESGLIRLNYDLGVWSDIDELESLESQFKSASGSAVELANLYRKAVALYRGPYLDGCIMEWTDAIRVRLNRTVVTALGKLLELGLQSEKYEQVEEHANELLRIDSCNQEATLALIKALVHLGRPEQAVRQFQLYGKTLERELGLEPSIEAVEAYNRLMLLVKK